ncbi:MAG TPA: hypothetical protein VKB90_01975 [Candidatus Acidoferrum sp.]|nr:hypothetical protein [Candidatus Acidoferrum sp.]
MAAFWLLGGVLLLVALVLLFLWHPRIGELFHKHVQDRPKRRLFLAAVGFFCTLAFARGAAYAAGRGIPPFHYVYIHGIHVHHLVWGILLLLVVGFGWLIEIGTGTRGSSLFASRLMSLLYGIAVALTLDEFALWLNLEDRVYWTREGRASLDALLLFGAALLIGIWGKDFLKALPRELFRPTRRGREEQKL